MKSSTSAKLSFRGISHEKLCLVAAISFITVVYVSTLSVNHSEAEDSLYYLMDISRGSLGDQVHPNHLLYNLINYLFLHSWQLIGYQGSVEVPVKIINIAGSLCTLLLVYSLATYLKFQYTLRYFCVFGVAFTCGYWWYSVECETYILPLIFVLLCFRQLIRIQEEFHKVINHILLGIYAAIAILLHQQHCLLGLTIVIGYLLVLHMNQKKTIWKQFIFRMSLCIFVCAFVTISSYLIAAIFFKGLTTYSHIENYILGRYNNMPVKLGYWSIGSVLLGIIGFLRTIIGGHFLFSFSTVANTFQQGLPGSMLREEVFLVKDFSMLKSLSLCGLAVIVAFGSAFIAFQIAKKMSLQRILSDEALSTKKKFVFALILSYLITYSIFNIWWEPQNSEYWVSIVPLLFLAFGILLSALQYKRFEIICMLAIILCLFTVNLFGSVLPQTNHKNDYWYAFNHWLIHNCKSNDLVVSGSAVISDAYVQYYTGARVLSIFPDDKDIDEKFRKIIASENPQRIFFTSTIYAPPKEYLKKYKVDNSASKKFFEKSKNLLSLLHSNSWQTIYLYNLHHETTP